MWNTTPIPELDGLVLIPSAMFKIDEGPELARGTYGLIRQATRVGGGGLGTQPQLPEHVIVKTPVGQHDNAKSLMREFHLNTVLRNMGTPRHPNIVKVLGVLQPPVEHAQGVSVTNGIVMETWDDTLGTLLNHLALVKKPANPANPYYTVTVTKLRRGLSVKADMTVNFSTMMWIMLQVIEGVRHAEECGVYHGDLSLSNILLRYPDDGDDPFLITAAITDFGCGGLRTREGTNCNAAKPSGNVEYLPRDVQLSTRCDIYAFGVLICCVLAGVSYFVRPDRKGRGGAPALNPNLLNAPAPHHQPLSLDYKMQWLQHAIETFPHTKHAHRNTCDSCPIIWQYEETIADMMRLAQQCMSRSRCPGTVKDVAVSMSRIIHRNPIRGRQGPP